jgi:hypothetical protein
MQWDNQGMQTVDLQNGMECYFGRDNIGYTSGECSFTATVDRVELFQGQPSKKMGDRIAKIDAVIKLGCLSMTPDMHKIASVIGNLVQTEETSTETVTDDRLHLMETNTSWLRENDVTSSSIVVKSGDGSTTYTKDTDYAVVVDGNRTGIVRITEGGIPNDSDVVASYSYTKHNVTPHLFYGAARDSVMVENIVFHKYNPGAVSKPHHIIQFWKAVAQSDYVLTYNQDAQEWMVLDVELGVLSDEENTQAHHDLCPLFYETWADEFDINNLPQVPTDYMEQ